MTRMPGQLIWAVAHENSRRDSDQMIVQRFSINVVHTPVAPVPEADDGGTRSRIRRVLHPTTLAVFPSQSTARAADLYFQLFHSVSLVAQISATVRHTKSADDIPVCTSSANCLITSGS